MRRQTHKYTATRFFDNNGTLYAKDEEDGIICKTHADDEELRFFVRHVFIKGDEREKYIKALHYCSFVSVHDILSLSLGQSIYILYDIKI